MQIVDVISVAELTTKHVVVNWGLVFGVERNGVFVTATFKVMNWDLKSGRGYRMEHKETWHESHEVCVFVRPPAPQFPVTWVSEETEEVKVLECRWARAYCSEDRTAVALRGQWEGGDADMDPHWIPVCQAHDEKWDINVDTGEALPERYRLPRIPLKSRRM